MKKTILLKMMILQLCLMVVGISPVLATTPVTLVSGSGTSGYVVPTGWTSDGTVAGGTYLKIDGGTLTSPSFGPYNSLSFAYTVATFGSGTNHPLTIRILNASTNEVLVEKTTATPTSSSYISTGSPISLGDIDVNFKIQLYAPTGKGIRLRDYSVTGVSASSDPSSAAAFANATPTLDLKDALSYTQTATTADGYSTTAGASITYSITSNTAGATINSSTGEVTPTKEGSVTVQATAAAISGKFLSSTATYTLTVTDTRTFNVTCHVGNNTSIVARLSNALLSLDDPASICGMSFVGWSSTNNVVSPTWVDNSTKVTDNMELYAMFEAVAGEYSYRLVEADQADWRGDYLIAYSSTIFADGRVGGTDGLGKSDQQVNPETNLSGKVVDAEWGDNYNVTIVAKNDNDLSAGYLMKTKDGKYNYQTSNNNGLSTTTSKSTAADYPLSITFNSSSDIAIAISAGAVFHYNESGFFRFYKDGGQKKVYLYKRSQDAAPAYSLGLTESITVTAAGYATFVSDYDLDYTSVSGLKAYKATVSGENITFTKVTTVPAGEGVLIKADAGNYSIPVTTGVAAWAADDNAFVRGTGAAVASQDGSVYNYVLSKHNDEVGFYPASGKTVGSDKAYISTTIDAARLTIAFDDETTGISSALMNSEKVNGVYNLNGQRVNKAQKGLYIINGKKVIK